MLVGGGNQFGNRHPICADSIKSILFICLFRVRAYEANGSCSVSDDQPSLFGPLSKLDSATPKAFQSLSIQPEQAVGIREYCAV